MERTILEIVQKTPDYRKGNAIRHKLVDILMIAILTFICNGNGYAAMRIFGKNHESELKKFLELPNGIPSQDTFEHVFAKLNPKTLSSTLRETQDDIRKEALNNERLLASIDGKTLCGSKRLDEKAVHIVSAYASELRLVLGELATEAKSNEITAIPKLLEMFCKKGMVITIDAMGTQTKIAEEIIAKEADYVLSVKGNQETLHTDISLLVEYELIPEDKDELRRNGQYENTIEKGHGRIETRECYICPETDWLTAPHLWKGLTGFGVIISKRELIGKAPTFSKEYFIYSLDNTSAAELLHIKKSHWSIENSLHWVLDVVFREDDSRARLENAPENLNVIRKHAAQSLRSHASEGSISGKRYLCSLNLSYALDVAGVK